MPLFEGLALGTDKHSVVIEIGQAYTKCGFVHEYSPRAILRSEVSLPPMGEVTKLHDIKDTERLFTALKEFIENIYFQCLAVNPKIEGVLFTYFDIPGILIVPQHLTVLLTLGLQSALVVDVGYSECSVIPTIEGITPLDCMQFGPLGSKAIHDKIMEELVQSEATYKKSNEVEKRVSLSDKFNERVIEDIKVRTCFLAPFDRGNRLIEYKAGKLTLDEVKSGSPKDVQYSVDGDRLLTIPGMVRESACQVLFEIYGNESTVTTLILDSLKQSPRDLRKLLAENIVLVGGTTLLPGFRHRLHRELNHLVKTDNRYSDNLYIEAFKFHKTPCKENYASWLGAAIFGSTDAITLRCVTRDQYMKSNGSVITDWSDWWPQPQRSG
ncbi:Actin-related protein 10 [Halotydeus destructor]|nr:Actin-related protein 10 [Halotydeus destructor]